MAGVVFLMAVWSLSSCTATPAGSAEAARTPAPSSRPGPAGSEDTRAPGPSGSDPPTARPSSTSTVYVIPDLPPLHPTTGPPEASPSGSAGAPDAAAEGIPGTYKI